MISAKKNMLKHAGYSTKFDVGLYIKQRHIHMLKESPYSNSYIIPTKQKPLI